MPTETPERTADRPVMGELLLREGLLTREQLERALEEQRHKGGRLGYHLIRLGIINVQRLSQFLRESMGLIPYDLVTWVKDPSITDLLPANLAQFYQVVPVELNGQTLTVAIADLDNPQIIPALEELTGLNIDPVVCPRETVVKALEHFYGIAKDPGVVRHPTGDHLFILSLQRKHIRPIHWSALKPDSAATEWLRAILVEAIRTGCRHLIVKPAEESIRIAFRTSEGTEERFSLDEHKRVEMDGLLQEMARLKDRRRGARMEGRIRLQVEARFLSLHVKALGTLQGIRYALTLHDEKVTQGEWEAHARQLSEQERVELLSAFTSPSGLILLAGSAGAGMGSIYYALMAHLRSRHRHAIALEEYSLLPLGGIAQVEVSRQEETSWPEVILQALKQDPDFLAIYPVKERRSMELALLAASQRLVLGVIHQPNAAACLRWLLTNQFKSPLKAGVLKGVLTVASMPVLCPHCRLPIEVPHPSGRAVALSTRQGCERCLSWDSLPTEEILEWFPFVSGEIPLEEAEVTPAFARSFLERRGGVPLSRRLLQRAQEGAIDGAEVRDYL